MKADTRWWAIIALLAVNIITWAWAASQWGAWRGLEEALKQ